MNKGKIIRDNKGMSLLEIIIAVTILGIIVVPLLNLFVASASLTFKGKKVGLATTGATSIYEKVKAAGAGTLISDASTEDGKKTIADYFGINQTQVSQDASSLVKVNKDGKDIIRNQKIRLSDYIEGGRHYDVDISLAAAPTSTDTIVKGSDYLQNDLDNINKYARTIPMAFNGTWIQPDEGNDPDQIVRSVIPDSVIKAGTTGSRVSDTGTNGVETDTYSGGQKAVQRITRNTREIDVDLTRVSEDTDPDDTTVTRHKVKAKITYKYNIEWDQQDDTNPGISVHKKLSDQPIAGTTKDGNFVCIENYFPEVVYSTEKDGVETPVDFDLILFYKPYYDSTDRSARDLIVINNTRNLQGSFFVIKRKADDTKPYSGLIQLIENHPGDRQHFNLDFHTNMGLHSDNFTAENKNALAGGQFRLIRMAAGGNSYSSSSSLTDADRNNTITTIIKQEPFDHLYYMTVDIYDHGDTSKPLYTMTGIKKI